MKVGVVGGRTFSNYNFMDQKLSSAPYEITEVVSGGANGADKLSIKWAKKAGLDWKEFLPDHKRYRHAFHHRNRLIAEYCDVLIAFWDGKSTGTKYTIDYAKRIGKPVHVFKY